LLIIIINIEMKSSEMSGDVFFQSWCRPSCPANIIKSRGRWTMTRSFKCCRNCAKTAIVYIMITGTERRPPNTRRHWISSSSFHFG